MADGVYILQIPSDVAVGNTPCCGEPLVTMDCRISGAAYGTKCGYVPNPYAGLPVPRFFRDASATITSTINGSLEYTEDPPPDPASKSGSTTCTYTFAGGCSSETWSVNFEYATGELGGEDTVDNAAGTGEGTGVSICPGIHEAWVGGGVGPNAEGFTVFSLAPTITAATIGEPSEGCENWAISWSSTEVGHFSEAPEYDYEESASVTGSIALCDEHTTLILLSETDAEAEEADPEEWTNFEDEGATCCGTRDLSADQTIYFVDLLQIRFDYIPPCSGGVRIRYKVTTTIDGVDTEQEHTVDNPGSAAIDIEMPLIDPETSGASKVSVCVTEFSAQYL